MPILPAPEIAVLPAAEPVVPPPVSPPAAAPPRPRCQRCGAPARVQVLAGYAGGAPVLHRACLACADAALAAGPQARSARPRLRGTVLLAGAVLLFVGLLGDWLVPDGRAGFGWHQRTGLLLGVVVSLLGLLVRVNFLTLLGAYLAGAALLADWTGLTRGPGIGWKQQLLLAAGGAVLAAVAWRGLVARRRGVAPRPAAPAAGCASLA